MPEEDEGEGGGEGGHEEEKGGFNSSKRNEYRHPSSAAEGQPCGYEVVMGGAESFGTAGLMYLVFVVDLASLDPMDEEAMDVVGQAVSEVILYLRSLLLQPSTFTLHIPDNRVTYINLSI